MIHMNPLTTDSTSLLLLLCCVNLRKEPFPYPWKMMRDHIEYLHLAMSASGYCQNQPCPDWDQDRLLLPCSPLNIFPFRPETVFWFCSENCCYTQIMLFLNVAFSVDFWFSVWFFLFVLSLFSFLFVLFQVIKGLPCDLSIEFFLCMSRKNRHSCTHMLFQIILTWVEKKVSSFT